MLRGCPRLVHPLEVFFFTLQSQTRKLDAEMDEEMLAHVEMQTQVNIRAGMQPEEARFAGDPGVIGRTVELGQRRVLR
jgi:hypothetical protein